MIRRAVPLVLLVVIGACAPRVPPAPPATIAPKFPGFIMPTVPADLGTPAARERHDIAWRWLQAGDLRTAERNFQSALKQSAAFYPAEAGLGYVALARDSYKESLLHFDRAVVANPRYAPALAGRAEVLLALNQPDEALQSLEAALQADPALTGLRSRIEVLRFRTQQQNITAARAHAEAGRADQARAAYKAAIAASPGSPFLHRELAEVERRAGNPEAALEQARIAADLDADEPRTFVMIGELHEAEGDYERAVEAYTTALLLQPDDEVAERLDSLRARAAFEAMPPEYRAIETSPAITQGELAALLAVRLEPLLQPSRPAVVVTDTRAHWAAGHILTVTRAGVIEAYPNHTFQPNAVVRRADLAQAVSRVLQVIAARDPQLGASWRNTSRTFPDVGPRHQFFSAASVAVEAGVMTTMSDGTFQVTRPVSGAEAAAAVNKLQELGGRPTR
jgi:tetratricopeptide (TPR) repeat protein